MSKERGGLRQLAAILVPTYLVLIYGAPALCLIGSRNLGWPLAALLVVLAPLTFVGMAALLSMPHRRFVVEGRMPLDTGIPSYFHRRLHGLCWTSVYYSGPVYFAILSVPFLKRATFRAFGYRGSMNFTIYPDTWIRDLPLLDFGDGTYLSNKATIGSNMIFIRNGQKIIEVGRITTGKNAMVGHLAMIGPSTTIGNDVQIGVNTGIGRRVTIGDRAVIGDTVVLDHGSKVDPDGCVPTRSYVGMGRTMAEDDEVSPGTNFLRQTRSRRRDSISEEPMRLAPNREPMPIC